MKILVVEDQPVFCEVLDLVLQPLRHDVSYAHDTDSALAALETLKPDLVVLDVSIPGWLDGYELCRNIRADHRLAHTCVYMLSARSGTQAVQRGRQVGADRYFTKPFSPLELLGAIDDAARQH